jgi:predicted HNH restriction endonuclease
MAKQNRKTGAAADKWGRETARYIASQIGAKMKKTGSNEATFRGKKVVIKCAAPATDRVGVTSEMLSTLDSVIAAFSADDGSFELWMLRASVIRSQAPLRSRRKTSGAQRMIRKTLFVDQGKHLGSSKIPSLSRSSSARSYLTYWKPHNIDWQNPGGIVLDHSAGDQLRKVMPSDRLYIISYRDGVYYLLGRMVVEEITNQARAAKLLGRKPEDLWESDHHVVASTPVMRAVAIPFTEILKNLELKSPHKIGPLKGPNSVQSFRVMRELTNSSMSVLDALLADATLLPPLRDLDIHIDQHVALEGAIALRNHLERERDPAIIKLKKQSAETLICEVCGFSFEESYGTLAAGYCEVHHLLPLSLLDSVRKTRLEDLVILCANCHRVAHLRTPPFEISEIRSMLKTVAGR